MDISPSQNLRTAPFQTSSFTRLRGEVSTPQEPGLPRDVFQSENRVKVVGSEEVSSKSLQHLTSTLDEATSFFEENFGPVQRGLSVDLTGDNGALRTGFNFEQNTINFPPSPKLSNRGLNSKDIIIHEAFHALVFQAYPEICTEENLRSGDSVRIHEGLADYFAYQMNPDEHFGENYSKAEPHLRSYRNGRRISLSPGAHSQGNAITSYLLKNKVKPSQVKEFLESGNFTLEGLKELSPAMREDLELDEKFSILANIPNYPESAISRYRLEEGKPLVVRFDANESVRTAHPDLKINWYKPDGTPSQDFEFKEFASQAFEVEGNKNRASEKVVAVYSDDGTVLGSQPFYLSQRYASETFPKPSAPKLQ